MAFALRHSEYLGYLNRAYRQESGEANPLVRRTELDGAGDLGLGFDEAEPFLLGMAITLDEWQNGDRELRVTGRNGLHLGGLRLDHSLTLATQFPADGSEVHHGRGRLALGGTLFGGRQEGVIDYEVTPTARITRLGWQTDWDFARGALLAAVDHRPLEGVSGARLGLSQQVGPFDMTSDVTADSTGAYRLGLSFSLRLGGAAAAESWRLSTLLAGLRAEQQPPVAQLPRPLLDSN